MIYNSLIISRLHYAKILCISRPGSLIKLNKKALKDIGKVGCIFMLTINQEQSAILPFGTQNRVKYTFLTNEFFITFNQYSNTFHLSYCTSPQHKVDISIVEIFSIICDVGFVPSVSKTLLFLLFINIFAPKFCFGQSLICILNIKRVSTS